MMHDIRCLNVILYCQVAMVGHSNDNQAQVNMINLLFSMYFLLCTVYIYKTIINVTFDSAKLT